MRWHAACLRVSVHKATLLGPRVLSLFLGRGKTALPFFWACQDAVCLHSISIGCFGDSQDTFFRSSLTMATARESIIGHLTTAPSLTTIQSTHNGRQSTMQQSYEQIVARPTPVADVCCQHPAVVRAKYDVQYH